MHSSSGPRLHSRPVWVSRLRKHRKVWTAWSRRPRTRPDSNGPALFSACVSCLLLLRDAEGAPLRPTPHRQDRRRRASWYAEPAKVADNFYFIGTKIHNAWALVGSDGIIVFEALFEYAAPDEIADGMRKLGLDVNKVKYVLLSHAHGDHDGGARFLQDKMPAAHLVYGGPDWDAVDKSTNRPGGKPKRDTVGADGMKLSVGDASVQIVTTPGHTAGTLSFLFEIKDNGKPLRVAYVGGTAIPFDGHGGLLRRLYRVGEEDGEGSGGLRRDRAAVEPHRVRQRLLQGAHRREPEAGRSEPVRCRSGRSRPLLHGGRPVLDRRQAAGLGQDISQLPGNGLQREPFAERAQVSVERRCILSTHSRSSW